MANTIYLKGTRVRKEGVASEVMSPGHFVVSAPTRGNSGDQGVAGSLEFPVAVEVVAQGVVLEYELTGRTINDAYAAKATVLYVVPQKGDEVMGRVAAGTTAITVGTPLGVQTDGTLVAGTFDKHHIVATAIEAVDNSEGAEEVFIQVEIV